MGGGDYREHIDILHVTSEEELPGYNHGGSTLLFAASVSLRRRTGFFVQLLKIQLYKTYTCGPHPGGCQHLKKLAELRAGTLESAHVE